MSITCEAIGTGKEADNVAMCFNQKLSISGSTSIFESFPPRHEIVNLSWLTNNYHSFAFIYKSELKHL